MPFGLLAALLLAQVPDGPPDIGATVSTESSQESHSAEQRYEAALRKLFSGDLAGAARAFDQLAGASDAGEVAEAAGALAEASREMSKRGRFVLKAPSLGDGALEAPPDRSGRAELVIFSTLYGIWVGIATAAITDADGPKPYVGLATAGAGGGFALSFLMTREGAIPDGQAATVEAAALWGAFNGTMVGLLSDASPRSTVGITLGAGLAGLAGAAVFSGGRDISAGDVALLNTGGAWALASSLFVSLAFLPDSVNPQMVEALILAATDLGLISMAVLSRSMDVSRGRVLVVDAAGFAGMLAGLSVPLFADSGSRRAYGISGLVGMAVGLTAGVVLVRHWDDQDGGEQTARTYVPRPYFAALPDGRFQAGVVGQF